MLGDTQSPTTSASASITRPGHTNATAATVSNSNGIGNGKQQQNNNLYGNDVAESSRLIGSGGGRSPQQRDLVLELSTRSGGGNGPFSGSNSGPLGGPRRSPFGSAPNSAEATPAAEALMAQRPMTAADTDDPACRRHSYNLADEF